MKKNDEMRGAIKEEIIAKFDDIKIQVDIYGQKLIQQVEKNTKLIEQEKSEQISKIAQKTGELVENVNVCYDLALKDVNDHFDDLDKEKKELDPNKTKEQIKREVIKHGLVFIGRDDPHFKVAVKRFAYGLLVQVDFHFGQNELDFLR